MCVTQVTPTLSLVLLVSAANAFYLPGVAPRQYADGERVEVKVHKLSSPKTQLPYDYYSLPFCKPEEVTRQAENLGEVMSGAIIQNSPYELYMGRSEFKIACRSVLDKKQKQNLATKVRQDYRVHMIMDNLPAATKMIAEMPDGTKKDMYDRGFRLGFMGSKDIPGTDANKPYINNHLRFIVKYHKSDTFPGARIVGFEVEAYSVKHEYTGEWNAKEPKLTSVPLRPELPPMPAWSPEVIFTYDCVWEHSDIAWASRWDLYLYMGDDQVHWFSILNSLVIVFLLSGIVAMIMVRTLRRDLAEYNSIEEKEELLEESGWKLVHADVLRTPPNATLLACSVGTGSQLLCMSAISIACAALGFLSPANRGSMLTVTLLLFVLMGSVAGYAVKQFRILFTECVDDLDTDLGMKHLFVTGVLNLLCTVFQNCFVTIEVHDDVELGKQRYVFYEQCKECDSIDVLFLVITFVSFAQILTKIVDSTFNHFLIHIFFKYMSQM